MKVNKIYNLKYNMQKLKTACHLYALRQPVKQEILQGIFYAIKYIFNKKSKEKEGNVW